MSADLIDISQALEKRKFQEQDERLAKMRDAFRAARTGNSPQPPAKGKSSRKGRSRPR
jgi:hypothetical protein